MVLGPDQIARELAATREDMGERIVELRRRGESTARRTLRMALVVGAAGAVVGAGVVAAVVLYRVTRPTSRAERLRRVVPKDLIRQLEDLRHRLRHDVPTSLPGREGKARAEKRETPAMQRLLFSAAQAATTAAAGALVSRMIGRAGRKAA